MDQFKQAAAVTLEFLKRTDIKGSEWRTFGASVQFLEAITQGQLIVGEIRPQEPEKPIESEAPKKTASNGKEAPA